MSEQIKTVALAADEITFKKQSAFKETWRRMRKSPSAMIGLVVVTLLILSAVFADVIVNYDKAIEQNPRNRLKPPSAEHIFGTDLYGRDLFARVVHGGRVSLSIGFISTVVSLAVGLFFGAAAGYYGRKVDDVIMRLTDILNVIPTILLSLAIVSSLGPGMRNLIIAISISRIPAFIRIIRSAVMSVVDMEFIEAARAGGGRDIRIILKHILPNSMGTIIVQTTMNISQMILQAATLSFIGMGVEPPRPEWGFMLNEGREFMRTSMYLLVFPGACIILAALSLNLLGDGFRDALDPRLKS